MSSIYAVIIGLLYLGIHFLRFQELNAIIWLAVGYVIGIGMMEFDELAAFRWYNESTEKFLITRSPIFLLSYLPLAIFGLTSSGSILGSGLLLGIGVTIWIEMLEMVKKPAEFKQRFLSQVAVPVSPAVHQRIVIGATFSLAILASILLW
jgi:hypothetical protein